MSAVLSVMKMANGLYNLAMMVDESGRDLVALLVQ